MNFLISDDLPGIFIDGLVCDAFSQLVFLSAWGSETLIQQFRARLSLTPSEGGLVEFYVKHEDTKPVEGVQVGDIHRFDHVTGRPAHQTVFTHLTHLWVYDRLTVLPDRANRRYLLLSRTTDTPEAVDARIWQTIQAICPVPLLPSWQVLLTQFKVRDWVQTHHGLNVNACQIELPREEVE